jgi:hypothetical protein
VTEPWVFDVAKGEETTDMYAFRYPLLQPVRYQSAESTSGRGVLVPWSDTEAEIWISVFTEDFRMKDGYSDDVLGQVIQRLYIAIQRLYTQPSMQIHTHIACTNRLH